MTKRILKSIALLLVICMGIFAFSACGKTPSGQGTKAKSAGKQSLQSDETLQSEPASEPSTNEDPSAPAENSPEPSDPTKETAASDPLPQPTSGNPGQNSTSNSPNKNSTVGNDSAKEGENLPESVLPAKEPDDPSETLPGDHQVPGEELDGNVDWENGWQP